MKRNEIAKKHRVSEMMVSLLIRKKRHTTNKDLAMDVGRLTGRKPILYISPRVRNLYKKTWPELSGNGAK